VSYLSVPISIRSEFSLTANDQNAEPFEAANARLRDCPRKDHRGVDLISDALPFGRLCYGEPNAMSNAISYANFFSRVHDAVIRVYYEAGNVAKTPEHKGDFKEWQICLGGNGVSPILRLARLSGQLRTGK
jgi:hypothetical protein